jgi:hypothetical protein
MIGEPGHTASSKVTEVRLGSAAEILHLSDSVSFTPASRRSAASFNRSLGAKSGNLVDFAEPAQRSRATSPRGCDRTVCCEAAIHDSDSKRMETADNRAHRTISGKQDRRPQDHCKIPGGLNFGADPFARSTRLRLHARQDGDRRRAILSTVATQAAAASAPFTTKWS